MSDLRIVLKESVSNDDIDRLAWQQNWELYDLLPRTEKAPLTKIWITPDEQTGIHYIEDFYISVRYLLLRGNDIEKIAEKIQASLDTYSLEELHQKVGEVKDKNECIAVILRLGAATTQNYDPRIFQDFKTLMSHPHPDVREAAMFATTYAGWREFREALQHLKEHDPEPTVRKFARTTLESLAKNYWQEKAG
jgi:hypothetical protein